MDCPSDLFQQPPSQVCLFDPYLSRPDTTSTGSTISSLLHPNSVSQNWGRYNQVQSLFSDLQAQEEGQEMNSDSFGRKSAAGGTAIPQYRLGDRRKGSVLESDDWSKEFVKVKQLKVDSMVRREGESQREGARERRSAPQTIREEGGKRKMSREGRQRQRHELKLQLEETRGKLLELQRKIWRVYGKQHLEEQKVEEGEKDDVMNETEEMLSLGETDNHIASELHPLLSSSERNHGRTEIDHSEVFSEDPVDLDMDMDLNGGVWLGCSFVQGEWENIGGSEKFAETLKQELASAVARVIDRVLHLYAETNPTSSSTSVLAQEIPISKPLDPNRGKKPSPGGGTTVAEQAEALALVAKKAQDKRNSIIQGTIHKNSVISQANPSLPLLPQPTLSTLLPTRNKDSFLPTCPPNPPPLPLPLLHYTMQHLFARSMPSIPLHKDGLSHEPFMEFRTHNPSFPPLPLLGQLNAPHADCARDEVLRVGIDGGDAALYLGPGTEGLSPCHLKKAKLMFFYARYPSSNTLKTYFPDVKFNRCVTSQLIKWFSNFREFFYIQMERFARQATRESPSTARERTLRLGRNSELFRILNMHYNKSNDYQVPERFVEVSEVALREFFTAIQSGRDADPCWKKSIYKIICKLDSPVPDSFRLPGCPMDTHHMG